MTIVQTLLAVQAELAAERMDAGGGEVARELSIAITAVEDAIMRTNRAFALRRGIFSVADVQGLDG
jgi:hypothetical protein